MYAAVAHVRTTRATRYLTQLCDHTGRLPESARHRPGAPGPQPVQPAENQGVIDFGWARCTLTATDDALILRGEAEDPERLAELQTGLTRTLERVGRRDGLAVTWSAVPDEAPPDMAPPAAVPPAAALLAELLTPQGRANPYPSYAAAHALGPVAPLAGGYLLVTGYDAVNEVLRDPGFGLADPVDPAPPDATGPAPDALRSMTRSILRSNPPDHGRMRSLISQVFTPRRVATLRPAVEAAVDLLLDRLAATADAGGAVDFMEGFAFPLPVTVICELLGIPEADRDRFRPLAADLT